MDDNLDVLILQYRTTSLEQKKSTEQIQEQINALEEQKKEISQPYFDKLNSFELKIKDIILSKAKSYQNQFGKVIYTKGSIRRSWDLDALDAVCTSNPQIKDAIWPFREEQKSEPRIKISVFGE